MIHYHGTPLSGGTESQLALTRRHACISFESPETIEIAAEVCQSIILDNGAFSAWKRGAVIDFDKFMGWANLWMKHPACDWALIPDVIDGTEADNDALLITGDGWVPIWHMHESVERLERLCHDYPRVALGSSGEFATVGGERWWQRMAQAMDVACDSEGMPKAKLHGLRMLDPTVFSHLPLSSADSTNVARNIGMDSKWVGPYAPRSLTTRALLMMERIEMHASARRWCGAGGGAHSNLELFG